MMTYVVCVLGMDDTTASQVRVSYWCRYGAAILGVVCHHGVDPDGFPAETHRLDDLRAMVCTERGLAQLLRALSGRKTLLTNASVAYVHEVLCLIDLKCAFLREIAIERM